MSEIKRSLEVVNEMMIARGFEELNSFENKIQMKDDNYHEIFYNRNLHVVYVNKFDTNFMKHLILFLNSQECKHAIIIYMKKSTNPERSLKNSSEYELEVFNIKSLMFNITKHEYVPKHVKVDTCPYDLEKIWKIKINDPIVRFYNFKVGDILKIGETDYRLVDNSEFSTKK